MGLLARLLGRSQAALPAPPAVRPEEALRDQTRKELISMALRDTLKKHGIRSGCIAAEGLPCVSAARQRGLHVQLVFRDWDPGVLRYVVALEAAVRSRLLRLDPLSAAWVVGMSWRFAPLDPSTWPQLSPPDPLHARMAAAPAASNGTLRQVLSVGDAFHARKAYGARDFGPTLPM